MTGILIPGDRTVKQQARGFCLNPECFEAGQERFEFDVEHSGFCCPKCGANQSPLVGLLVMTHLLIRDQKRGKIIGQGGLGYMLGCDHTRAYLATVTNQEAATGDVSQVNCPGCLAKHAEMKLPKVAGMALFAQK